MTHKHQRCSIPHPTRIHMKYVLNTEPAILNWNYNLKKRTGEREKREKKERENREKEREKREKREKERKGEKEREKEKK